IKANWDLFSQPQFLHCHGITQSPSTGDFIMVMQYAQSDLRLYLQHTDTSSWKDKLRILKQIANTVHHWLVNDSLDVFSRKDGLAPAHNSVSTIRTHPDAVYYSRLLDYPELRGSTRRRQYLSLNIPRSVSEGSSNDLSQQPTQPSQDNPKH
ncbi:12313_t:CDS:2, partial [Gigaspora rosea]